MVKQSSSGALTRLGIIATVADAPSTVPSTRLNAFELVAPASGCEVI
jgi:hypothetical protein